jgi:hypothetical protein
LSLTPSLFAIVQNLHNYQIHEHKQADLDLCRHKFVLYDIFVLDKKKGNEQLIQMKCILYEEDIQYILESFQILHRVYFLIKMLMDFVDDRNSLNLRLNLNKEKKNEGIFVIINYERQRNE